MEYVIVMDSCGERTEAMKADERIVSAPLTMQVDDYLIVDDDSFDQADFLQKIAASPNAPKSACPSPDYYKKAFEKATKRAYAVTLSAELSGSCNSAVLARDLLEEEGSGLQVHVFNSRSASIGETLITAKIQECEAAGMPFEELVETVEAYIDGQNTYFVLENLETLRKNGRLSDIKAFFASALKIKPRHGCDPTGDDYAAGSGARDQQSSCEDGGLHRGAGRKSGRKNPGAVALQLSGARANGFGSDYETHSGQRCDFS